MEKKYQIVIDQSTSGTKVLLLKRGNILKRYDKAHRQIYPKVGWVEHDPLEIWQNVEDLLELVLKENMLKSEDVLAISITNQRETILAWDKVTGKILYNAIVWQCNRSLEICEELIEQGYEELINQKTGLRLDTYFSGTKIKWLSNEISAIKEKTGTGELAIGTMDSWLIWNLTKGGIFATDASNACRTLLYDINNQKWDEELTNLFGICTKDLPEIMGADAIYGNYKDIPIKGVMADSQAALFGESCNDFGDMKITMGTGCSIMMQVKENNEIRDKRILTTIAWQTKDDETHALEGIIRSCGDAINWFSQNISSLTDVPELCNRVLLEKREEQIYFIPALQGMGAPFWNNTMTAGFLGMKRTTTQLDMLQAVLESLVFQIKAVIDVMEEVSEQEINKVFVDGGISKNRSLMSLLATLLNKEVIVSEVEEFSALGVAKLANDKLDVTLINQEKISPLVEEVDIRLKYEKWKRYMKVFNKI